MIKDIIKGMLRAKRKAEKRLGRKNPWRVDFGWGRLSGKLSDFQNVHYGAFGRV